ncbi:hypothetical protein ACFXG4_51400 [Nocardia sp. NPDC059246]|uniref:hypothetical protein n=1 Tax=unclassified Nocardia TaxID=2637762 RepID=UPI0036B67190
MTRPTDLADSSSGHLDELLAACPEMTDLARLVTNFEQLMTECWGSDLDAWMKRFARRGCRNSIPSRAASTRTTTPASHCPTATAPSKS